MTGLDWIIVAFTVLLATWGYFQGLVVSGLSLGGFLVGAIAGGRIAPLLLQDGSHSPYAPLFSLVGAVFLGTMIAVLLEALGSNIRRRFVLPPLQLLDGIGGAVLIGAVALGLAWIAGAVALQTPGARKYRKDIQRSLILRRLNDVLPPSGSIPSHTCRGQRPMSPCLAAGSFETATFGRREGVSFAFGGRLAGSRWRGPAGSPPPASLSPTPT
jgi:colicin V production protein